MSIDPNQIPAPESFVSRHLGTTSGEQSQMLKVLGLDNLEALIGQIVPADIRFSQDPKLPEGLSEFGAAERLRQHAAQNKLLKSFIGQGYAPTYTPPVILRNILENPGWYTAYTPYQAEIAQGRLEMLFYFQTWVSELTGMPVANASLLDEATAAGEAMFMLFQARPASKKDSYQFAIVGEVMPQVRAVLQTRAEPLGIELLDFAAHEVPWTQAKLFGAICGYPDGEGALVDWQPILEHARTNAVRTVATTDPLSLVLLKSPGELGFDVAVGNSQRFGLPMAAGGPHAAYFACREEFIRLMPGRLIGLSKDASGNPAYRMALQTREQHIRREKATSNICTAQALPAVAATAYAIYHGPDGLREIAKRIHGLTCQLAVRLRALGFLVRHQNFFDTLWIETHHTVELKNKAVQNGYNFSIQKMPWGLASTKWQ
jgi:glycine dehydrogenase